MNRLLWLCLGICRVRLVGGSVHWVLNSLSQRRIPFWEPEWLDELTVELQIFPRDLEAVKKVAEQRQCELLQVRELGLRKLLRSIIKRWALVMMAAICLLSLWMVPKLLLFYEVTGNETVPDDKILRALEELGIGVGIYGPEINPRWIKDHVLNLIPELQWITVTQNGCRATVVVRERPETPGTLDRKGYAHVFASRAGLITQQRIFAGQPMKQVGDIVTEGEMLVSGLVDLERVFVMEYAQAEIFARTWRKTTAVTPDTCWNKTPTGQVQRCVWLEIGCQRIKIFGNSGISTTGCDKMIHRKILSLPDGLTLPVSILIETVIPWSAEAVRVESEAAISMLDAYVRQRAAEDMIAGEIRWMEYDLEQTDGAYRMDCTLECYEMIAETVEAKWNEEDFADD